MSVYFNGNRLMGLVCVALLCLSCQSAAEKDKELLSRDRQSVTQLQQLKTDISSRLISPESFENLKKLREKYPNSDEIAQTYKMALIIREDWATLQIFLTATPLTELSREDQTTLGKVYVKLGRYEDAANIGKSLAETDPNDLEGASIFSHASFYLGKYDEAAQMLDRVWQQLLSQKKADEITLRGMIYFHRGDNAKAIETLNKALEINPDNVAALNGLSRIFAAQGDTLRAEEYIAKHQKVFDKVTAQEKAKSKFVDAIHRLQKAYTEKRFEDVVSIATQMIPDADAKTKPTLYQYLANAYQALGKQKEAQQALADGAKLQQK